MKKLLPLILMLVMLGAAVSQAHGQEAQSAQSFASFWAQFTAAVAKNDKEAVATMTKFPVEIGDPITRAAFLKKYPKIFNQKVRRCFAKETPVRDNQPQQGGGSYSMFCGDDIFYFERVDGKYLFAGIGVND